VFNISYLSYKLFVQLVNFFQVDEKKYNIQILLWNIQHISYNMFSYHAHIFLFLQNMLMQLKNVCVSLQVTTNRLYYIVGVIRKWGTFYVCEIEGPVVFGV
jgi:hypothetical protein